MSARFLAVSGLPSTDLGGGLRGESGCVSRGKVLAGLWASASIPSRGHEGLMRDQTCRAVTVSLTRSTAGGCEVTEAAVRTTVIPIPSSASTRRRRRGITALGLQLRSNRKLVPPNAISAPSITALAETITP